jgi:trimeric autotransporter adhesin
VAQQQLLTSTGKLVTVGGCLVFLGPRVRAGPLPAHAILTARTSQHCHVAASVPGHGALKATAHAEFWATAALAAHGALTGFAESEFSRFASLAAHGGLAGVAHATEFTLSGNLSGHGHLSALATAVYLRPVALAAHGSATAELVPKLAVPITGRGALTATTVPKVSVTVALAGHGSAAATAQAGFHRTATLAAAGHLTGTAFATEFTLPTTTLPAHGAVTATAMPKFARAVTISGIGHVAATALADEFTLATSVSGHGALTVAAYAKFTRSAALTAHGVSTVTAKADEFTLAGALSAHGQLTAVATAKYLRPVSLAGAGVLSAAVFAKFSRAAAVAAHGAVAATVVPKLAVAITGRGALSATVLPIMHTSATIAGHGALTPTAFATEFTLPVTNISAHGALTATAFQTFFVSAALGAVGQLNVRAYGFGFAVYSSTGAGYTSNSTSSASWFHPANVSDYVIATVFSANIAPSGATYGGVAMTNLGPSFTSEVSGGFGFVTMFGIGGVSGSATVVVNFGGTALDVVANSLSYINVAAVTAPVGVSTQFGFSSSQGPLVAPTSGTIVQAFGGYDTTSAGFEFDFWTGGSARIDAATGPTNSAMLLVQDSTASTTFTTILNARSEYLWCSYALAVCPGVVARDPAGFGHGALTATAIGSVPRPVSLPGHGVLSAGVVRQYQRPAALSGHGVLSVATKQISPVPAVLHSHGALTATTTAKLSVTAALAGHGALAATAHATEFTLSAALAGHGVLTITATAKFTRTAALPGHGVVTATAVAKVPAAAAVVGHGVLSSPSDAFNYTLQFPLAPSPTAHCSLTGQGTLSATAGRLGKLTGQGTLSATATIDTAPGFDSFSNGNNSATGTTSWTHTLGPAAKMLLVTVGTLAGAATSFTRTAKCGSTSMTSLGAVQLNGGIQGAAGWGELFTLLNPPTGTQTITITTSSGTAAISGISVAYQRVSSNGTVVTNHGSISTGLTGAISTVTGALAFGVIVTNGSGWTSWSGTPRATCNSGTSSCGITAVDTPGTGSNVTLGAASASLWASFGLELSP